MPYSKFLEGNHLMDCPFLLTKCTHYKQQKTQSQMRQDSNATKPTASNEIEVSDIKCKLQCCLYILLLMTIATLSTAAAAAKAASLDFTSMKLTANSLSLILIPIIVVYSHFNKIYVAVSVVEAFW